MNMVFILFIIIVPWDYYREKEGNVSILIQVWGEVRSPGIHQVPPTTNLIEAISFAGGPTSKSDLGKVKLIKIISKESKVVYYDADSYLKGKGFKPPMLDSGDLIYIPQSLSSRIWDFFKFTSIVAGAGWTIYRIASE